MSNRYEQSLKEQAARIRRELAGEKETKPVERPKKEEREDRFVLTDVPSPIYGFQRPKKQRSIQEEIHSDESEVEVSSELKEERMEETLEHETDETNEVSRIETMEQTDLTEADAGLVPMTDADILVPEPTIELPIEDEVEEPSEEQESDDVALPEQAAIGRTIDEKDVDVEAESGLISPLTEAAPPHSRVVEDTQAAVPLETVEEETGRRFATPEATDVVAEAETTVAVETAVEGNQTPIKKPAGPPVNVVMTTKDLMAMYRARREQNNLHGKK
ncbi:hypothetical protein [Exiguobacterium antarcticum]|uniref:hypothetical protein n=1 Tax=Exiguobacterium antarcticum TaxID=132920 RepID=UPI000478C663|nr:hypothetical protein [Exiguobacterium antarcticum]